MSTGFLVGENWPAERGLERRRGGGVGSEVWMVGEIVTFPVRRIPTLSSSRAMNPNNNIYYMYSKCL